MAKVIAVNISEKKGTIKTPTDKIELKINHGIVGDAHAGPGIRQVSFLAKESHNKFQPHTEVCLKNGIFGENITTEGINLQELKLGQILRIGSTELKISKKGKECHAPCAIGKHVGRCIMPKECIFAMVIKEGIIKTGDEIEVINE